MCAQRFNLLPGKLAELIIRSKRGSSFTRLEMVPWESVYISIVTCQSYIKYIPSYSLRYTKT